MKKVEQYYTMNIKANSDYPREERIMAAILLVLAESEAKTISEKCLFQKVSFIRLLAQPEFDSAIKRLYLEGDVIEIPKGEEIYCGLSYDLSVKSGKDWAKVLP
jgi:hypothetical protein